MEKFTRENFMVEEKVRIEPIVEKEDRGC